MNDQELRWELIKFVQERYDLDIDEMIEMAEKLYNFIANKKDLSTLK